MSEVIAKLFITGKASTAGAIARALASSSNAVERQQDHYRIGENVVTWTGGHLYRLAAPEEYDAQFKQWRLKDLPILPGLSSGEEDVQPEQWIWRSASERQDLKRQLDFLRRALPKVREALVHAGDPDREGQWLIDQVLEQLGCYRPVLRLHLQSHQWRAVKQALDRLQQEQTDNENFKSLSISARTRSYADWLYGMNMTRAYTLLGRHGGYQEVISVGRVQTPLLALVVHRDELIESFKPEPLYHLQVKFVKGDEFCYSALDVDAVEIKAVEQNWQGACAVVSNKETLHHIYNPPLPLNLSQLQIECASRFAYSAFEVMQATKILFEDHHLITYPHSENRYLPEKFRENISEVVDAISQNFFDGFFDLKHHLQDVDGWRPSACWDNSKVDINHAIVPTAHILEEGTLTEQERAVYELICRFYLAQFFPDHEVQEDILNIEINRINCELKKISTLHLGWQLILPDQKDTAASLPDDLPPWNVGDQVVCENIDVRAGKTRPPQRFTDVSLMEAMAHVRPFIADERVRGEFQGDDGLGAESTRAVLIATLFRRGYLMKGNKSIYSTSLGRDLIHALPEAAIRMDMTALWEKQLKNISQMKPEDAESAAQKFLQDISARIQDFIEPLKGKKNIHVTSADEVLGLKTQSPRCPVCDSVLRHREGKYGEFWGCSAYPQCKYTQKI